jgi:hypothetical protein
VFLIVDRPVCLYFLVLFYHQDLLIYDATIDALKVSKRIEYLKTDGCERIKRDYNKKSERYWDDEIYHQR